MSVQTAKIIVRLESDQMRLTTKARSEAELAAKLETLKQELAQRGCHIAKVSLSDSGLECVVSVKTTTPAQASSNPGARETIKGAPHIDSQRIPQDDDLGSDPSVLHFAVQAKTQSEMEGKLEALQEKLVTRGNTVLRTVRTGSSCHLTVQVNAETISRRRLGKVSRALRATERAASRGLLGRDCPEHQDTLVHVRHLQHECSHLLTLLELDNHLLSSLFEKESGSPDSGMLLSIVEQLQRAVESSSHSGRLIGNAAVATSLRNLECIAQKLGELASTAEAAKCTVSAESGAIVDEGGSESDRLFLSCSSEFSRTPPFLSAIDDIPSDDEDARGVL